MLLAPKPWCVLAALAMAAPGASYGQGSDSTAGQGAGASYWGTIPLPADSTVAALRNRPRPAWESILIWPYRAIGLPFTLLRLGIGGAVQGLDKSHVPETVSRILRPKTKTFGFTVEFQAGGLTGFGTGLTADHRHFLGNNRLRASVVNTVRGDRRWTLGFRAPTRQGNAFEFGAGMRMRSYTPYFGLGPNTLRADESFYRQTTSWVGSTYRLKLGGGAYIEGEGLWSRVGAGASGARESPRLADRFAGAIPAGYDEASDGVSATLMVGHENTRHTGHPNSGGSRLIRATLFKSTLGPRATFFTYRAEVQQFVRLWFPDHVLAVRAYGNWIDHVSGAMPFQRYLTNDDPDLFRGFHDFRWRGLGMVGLNAEYRWPLWAFKYPDGPQAHMYLLTDIGQVFNDFDQIRTGNMTLSVGGGVRFMTMRGFAGRFEMAHSREGWVLRLRTDQIFQFSRLGLLYGRSPVPSR